MINGIFFIASFSNFGIGVAISGYNFLITSASVVGRASSVFIKDFQNHHQICDVIFIDYSKNIAFISLTDNFNDFFDISKVDISFEENEVKLKYINFLLQDYSQEASVVETVDYNNLKLKRIEYKGNMLDGTLVFNLKDDLIGLLTHFPKISENYVIPFKYILNIAEEFTPINEKSLRCPVCSKIIALSKIEDQICPNCNSFINHELFYSSNSPKDKLTVIIEDIKKHIIIPNLKIFRIGKSFVELMIENNSLFLNYDNTNQELIFFTVFFIDEKYSTENLYEKLLQENFMNNYLTFSLENNKLYFSTYKFFVEKLNYEIVKEVLLKIFEKTKEMKQKYYVK